MAVGINGTLGSRATLHVAPEGNQRGTCLYCGVVLDGNGRRGGKLQKFCSDKPCRRFFWQEARRVGGKALRRRLKRARGQRPRATVPRAARRRLGFLIAIGAMPLFLLGNREARGGPDGSGKSTADESRPLSS